MTYKPVLDWGRDEIDHLIRKAGNEWWEACRKATPTALRKAIQDKAKDHGVDWQYLMWILLNDRKSWIVYAGADMLDAAMRMYLDGPMKFPNAYPTLPDDLKGEYEVNAALKDLAQWSDNDLVAVFAKFFTSIIKSKGRAIVDATKAQGEDLSMRAAQMTILVELPLRVRDHPHWFRDPTTLWLLCKGVIG